MAHELDVVGVKCPLNWAKAKVRLGDLASGEILEVLVDDPRAVRDIPRAAEAEGHAIVDVREESRNAGRLWRIVIEC